MRPPTSLRQRLIASLTGLSMAVLSLSCLLAYAGSSRALYSQLDLALWTISQTEAASALDSPTGKLHVHLSMAPPGALGRAGYPRLARIETPEGVRVAGSRALRLDPLLRQEALEGTPGFANLLLDDQPFRAIYVPIQRKYVLMVAMPTAPLRGTLATLALILVVCELLGCLASFLAARTLARRLLAPLEEMERAAEEVASGNPRAVIPDHFYERELLSLGGSLNTMVGRLRHLLEEQKRFMRDVSHELRSPVTNVQGTLEVTLRRPRSSEEYVEAMGLCLRESARLGKLIEDMLALSRGEQQILEPEPIELAELARQAVEAHRARAEALGLRLELLTGPTPARAAIRYGCARSWTTCWTTPCATPIPARACGCVCSPTGWTWRTRGPV